MFEDLFIIERIMIFVLCDNLRKGNLCEFNIWDGG